MTCRSGNLAEWERSGVSRVASTSVIPLPNGLARAASALGLDTGIWMLRHKVICGRCIKSGGHWEPGVGRVSVECLSAGGYGPNAARHLAFSW